MVSGPSERVEQFASELKAQGIDTRKLHTSHAFHSAMMDPILEPFSRAVEKARPRPPNIPIVSTMTGKLLSPEASMLERVLGEAATQSRSVRGCGGVGLRDNATRARRGRARTWR